MKLNKKNTKTIKKFNKKAKGRKKYSWLLVILTVITILTGYNLKIIDSKTSRYYLGKLQLGKIGNIIKWMLVDKKPGLVINVYDGDTITTYSESKEKITVRLYGIDAPELDQKFGKESKKTLESLIKNKTIEIKPIGKDRYNRTVAIIYSEDININEQMIVLGMAWYYPQYCKEIICSKWEKLQKKAKENKVGLWKEKNPIGPQKFRKNSKLN